MSDDPNNSRYFTSPADQVKALRFSEDVCRELVDLYGRILPESRSGGMEVTGLYLARHLPSVLNTEGSWKGREGWVVFKCSVTRARFAVPGDKPVPTLDAEYQFADEAESVFHRPVHPELADDPPRLAEKLVACLGRRLHQRFLNLIGTAAKLRALSGMEELPKTSEKNTCSKRQGCWDYESLDGIPE